MDDDTLLAYVLDLLGPADRSAVEAHLADHPDAAAKVARARSALQPLEADRDGYDPPPGLAVATIARTAEYLVAAEPAGGPEPEPVEPARPWLARLRSEPDLGLPEWRRADLAVALSIGFVLVGLVLAGVGKLREQNRVLACQENLRELHVALTGYSDTHDGRFPQVGTQAVPVAGAFVDELARAGQYPNGPTFCPAAGPNPVQPVGYSYSLGYLTPNGQLVGLRRAGGPDSAGDWDPIAADLPARRSPDGGLVPAHARGQNVLFVGGAVRFATVPTVGVNGDDIYRNDAGLVRAGLHRADASLGRPDDLP